MIVWWATAFASGPEPGPHLLQVDVATEAKVPVVGWVPVTTRSLVLAELARDGDGFRVTQRVCDVRVLGGKPAVTTMPPALIAAIPPQVYPLSVRQEGTTLRIAADPGPTRVGQDGQGAPVDFEGDGRPGATVWLDVPVLGRVEVYVAQLGHTRWAGTWTEAGGAGRAEVVILEQRTLGASHAMFTGDRPTRVLSEASRFRLVPLAAGAGCAEALAAADPDPVPGS